MIDPSAVVHPLAHVEGATIGARSHVWQFASITGGCEIGVDCRVAPHSMMHGSRYGDRVVIAGGLMAGPGFLIGSDVFLGPRVTLCNDGWPRASKAHFDCDLFDGERWAVVVEDGASLGAHAVVLAGVRIGARSMIAAGAIVDRNIPSAHLFTRGGEIRPIRSEDAHVARRMRFAA